MKLQKKLPKYGGWYWGVTVIQAECQADSLKRYKSGKVFLATPWKSLSGKAELVYLENELKFACLHMYRHSNVGDGLHAFRVPVKDIALWSSAEICPPKEWRHRMPMTKAHLDFAKKVKIRPSVIREWKKPSDKPGACLKSKGE